VKRGIKINGMEKIPIYKTQGIIIKRADLGQADRLLTIYTKEYGKILVRAKGVNKNESKLRSLIEPFNLCEFSLAKSKIIDVLAGVYPIKEFVFLRQNLESLSLSIYFCELVDKLIPAPERDPKIWALLVRAMEALDESRKDLGKIKTAFEEKLLEFLGYGDLKNQKKSAAGLIQQLAGEEIKTLKFLEKTVRL